MAKPRKDTREENSRPNAQDTHQSQFYIDPNSLDLGQFHYRWVETHCMNQETQSINKALLSGYEPVKLEDLAEFKKHVEMLASIRGRKDGDEYVRNGDQILMRCPLNFYKTAKKTERSTAKEQMKHVDWASKEQAINAPVFVSENSYSRTRELSRIAQAAFADDGE